MIFVTGDTHIPMDIRKLRTESFSEQKTMTKDDYIIICGDFGGVWDNGAEEKYWLKWLRTKKFTTLFIDGNHENFDLLKGFPVTENWNGGKVQFINDSVIHLMRGQIYNLQGYSFFTFGGGCSIDKHLRTEGKSWWPQEAPSYGEYKEAIFNLNKNNWEVDYVITHTAGLKIMNKMGYVKENELLNKSLDIIDEHLSYSHWFFGHFHDDRQIDAKHTLVYNDIIKLFC